LCDLDITAQDVGVATPAFTDVTMSAPTRARDELLPEVQVLGSANISL
jgi:hypothetical protein